VPTQSFCYVIFGNVDSQKVRVLASRPVSRPGWNAKSRLFRRRLYRFEPVGFTGIANASSLQNEHFEPFDGFCTIGYVKLQRLGIDISIEPDVIQPKQRFFHSPLAAFR
jgi:hypothetical protein